MQIVDREESLSYKHYSSEWKWGFTPSAEIWNGRLAMVGIVIAVLIDLVSNQGVLHFWGIL
ncbi:high light inducible protein [Coleofasciculus sp. FACHB-64]|uniref:chlorophyll a/b-binding protein n=1 Tax=Cyanophyceae TaxID=3028117 RepID=UPI0016825D8E|nr:MULTISPECIES: chlorophyll a/b-binding protein [unclassified Coleofasciculus]MBD1836935.1 high light inducible protein [Coleofasciculus sp. FACHB-501]MBD1894883.1 high light inducible protein [Coleofasciculus sp. FACHB-129]MBD2049158.1 high light inducible protein [Coleofasciculus sp. FACHB-64]